MVSGFALKITTIEFISRLTLGLMASRCCAVLAREGRFCCCMFNGKVPYARAFIKVFLSLFNCHIMLL